MIKLDDNLILDTEIKTILIDLKSMFPLLFNEIKMAGDNIQTNCPFHKEGKELHPSFGINIKNGKCNCFSCGWKGNLILFISHLFNQSYESAKQWLVSRYNSTLYRQRNFEEVKRFDKVVLNSNDDIFVSDEELRNYNYIHPYLINERHLTKDIIIKFNLGYDIKTNSITVPYKDLNGKVRYIGRRRVDSKIFHYPQGVHKILYGAYEVVKGGYNYAWIVESVFNCLTCWKYNIPAIALSGKCGKDLCTQLNSLPIREYVIALDPDEAGKQGTEFLKHNLQGKLLKFIEYFKDDSRDINDLDSEILMLKKY